MISLLYSSSSSSSITNTSGVGRGGCSWRDSWIAWAKAGHPRAGKDLLTQSHPRRETAPTGKTCHSQSENQRCTAHNPPPQSLTSPNMATVPNEMCSSKNNFNFSVYQDCVFVICSTDSH
eukprot:EG_transcript_22078